ncbi:MAG: BACON domain-containing protein, partial [Desulfosarcina sp.]|nr:BACON domain-containing protein [Desulfosarcina sp.]
TSDCTYSISSNNNTISSDGGTGTFSVSTSSASCEWYAEANVTWVKITSESSGIGDGMVTYTVSPNTGAARTAVITIAGQTHTVIQDPALGSLKVTIYPPEAVSAGARWRVDGGDWNSSGETHNGLSVGNHLLEFNTIPDWIKPTGQTVTINNNQTTETSGEYSQNIVIDLSVYAYNIKNKYYADLTWSGANSTSVDVYRDGSIIATTLNSGAYTDGPFRKKTQATYQLCEAGTSICSNMVTVSW